MKKKLLIVVENFRNIFILLFISKISKKFDVTILTSKKKIPLSIKKKYKVIKIEKSWIEKIIDKICIYLSNCHGSYKQLYYLKFQIGSEKNIFKYILLKIKFLISKFRILPKSDNLYKFLYLFFSKKYDFLDNFSYLLFDFRVSDEYNPSKSIIYSSKLNKNLKKISWVYSWDNSYIYSSILSADYFLVWSKTLKNIFVKRHKVNPQKLLVNYPIQFQYLKKLKKTKTKTILFSCSYGSSLKNPEKDMQWYVKDDIEMIKHMHQIIKKNNLNLKILIRLYPSTNYNKKNLNKMVNYNNLDIEFDSFNFFKKKNFSLEEISSHLSKKNLSINKSLAIFSFGSTFNIEAAILNKPVFHIDYSVVKRSSELFEYDNFQKDIEDYVFLKKVKDSNVIKNPKEMKKILINLDKNNYLKYLKYSKALKKIYFHNTEKINIFS
jgi:hypothetical protein